MGVGVGSYKGESHDRSTTQPRQPNKIAMAACANGGDYEQVSALLRNMSAVGVTPDVESYNAAMAASGIGGKWVHAVALLEEMHTVGINRTVRCYHCATTACKGDGEWERALALLRETAVVGLTPDAFSYSTAISFCAKAGEWGAGVGSCAGDAHHRTRCAASCCINSIHSGTVGTERDGCVEYGHYALFHCIVFPQLMDSCAAYGFVSSSCLGG